VNYPDLAKHYGIPMCGIAGHGGPCGSVSSHMRGRMEFSPSRGRFIHWIDREVTKPGLLRFLTIVADVFVGDDRAVAFPPGTPLTMRKPPITPWWTAYAIRGMWVEMEMSRIGYPCNAEDMASERRMVHMYLMTRSDNIRLLHPGWEAWATRGVP